MKSSIAEYLKCCRAEWLVLNQWFVLNGLCFMVCALWFVLYGLCLMVSGEWFVLNGLW